MALVYMVRSHYGVVYRVDNLEKIYQRISSHFLSLPLVCFGSFFTQTLLCGVVSL